jgi:hypothetical protein
VTAHRTRRRRTVSRGALVRFRVLYGYCLVVLLLRLFLPTGARPTLAWAALAAAAGMAVWFAIARWRSSSTTRQFDQTG